MTKEQQKRLVKAANHTAFVLEGYLPKITAKFKPYDEIPGELEDCVIALREALEAIKKQKPLDKRIQTLA